MQEHNIDTQIEELMKDLGMSGIQFSIDEKERPPQLSHFPIEVSTINASELRNGPSSISHRNISLRTLFLRSL